MLWFYPHEPAVGHGSAVRAGMTNPPGLAAANSQTTTGVPTLAYASVYPVALIFKIILAQVLVELLHILH